MHNCIRKYFGTNNCDWVVAHEKNTFCFPLRDLSYGAMVSWQEKHISRTQQHALRSTAEGNKMEQKSYQETDERIPTDFKDD